MSGPWAWLLEQLLFAVNPLSTLPVYGFSGTPTSSNAAKSITTSSIITGDAWDANNGGNSGAANSGYGVYWPGWMSGRDVSSLYNGFTVACEIDADANSLNAYRTVWSLKGPGSFFGGATVMELQINTGAPQALNVYQFVFVNTPFAVGASIDSYHTVVVTYSRANGGSLYLDGVLKAGTLPSGLSMTYAQDGQAIAFCLPGASESSAMDGRMGCLIVTGGLWTQAQIDQWHANPRGIFSLQRDVHLYSPTLAARVRHSNPVASPAVYSDPESLAAVRLSGERIIE